MWAVDGEETGEWKWERPEEEKPTGSIESVGRATKEIIIIDEDGYETVRRPMHRTLGQYMQEIFAVEAQALADSSKREQSKSVDSMKREVSKKRFC